MVFFVSVIYTRVLKNAEPDVVFIQAGAVIYCASSCRRVLV